MTAINSFFPFKKITLFCFCWLFKFVSDQCCSSTCIFFLVSFLVQIVQLSYILIMFILLSSVCRLNSHCFLTLLPFNTFKSLWLFLCFSFVPLWIPYKCVLLPPPSPPTITTWENRNMMGHEQCTIASELLQSTKMYRRKFKTIWIKVENKHIQVLL